MPHATRHSIVFACLIALVAIGGTIAYVVANEIGSPFWSAPSVAANGALTAGSDIAPIDAGAAPRISIDDANTHVYISTSSDGKVHVADTFEKQGLLFGGHQRVSVTVSGSNVTIVRPHSGDSGMFLIGSMRSQLSVAVPAQASLAVSDADGLDINGVEGAISVHAGDGTVRVTSTKGALDIKAGGGRIYLTNVHAPRVVAHSYYGRLVFNDVTTEALDAYTRDGRILVDGLTMNGASPRAVLSTSSGPISVTASFPENGTYTLRTADGSIRLRLPPTSNLNVVAATNDGAITADSAFTMTGEGRHKTAKLGSAAGSVSVSSGDGSIQLETTGAF